MNIYKSYEDDRRIYDKYRDNIHEKIIEVLGYAAGRDNLTGEYKKGYTFWRYTDEGYDKYMLTTNRFHTHFNAISTYTFPVSWLEDYKTPLDEIYRRDKVKKLIIQAMNDGLMFKYGIMVDLINVMFYVDYQHDKLFGRTIMRSIPVGGWYKESNKYNDEYFDKFFRGYDEELRTKVDTMIKNGDTTDPFRDKLDTRVDIPKPVGEIRHGR